ncbi:MAG: DUF4131 domain-containing protein [Pseudomonadota bacterium]
MSAIDADIVASETSAGLTRIRLGDARAGGAGSLGAVAAGRSGQRYRRLFPLTVEPPLWLGLAAVALLCGGWLVARRAGAGAIVMIGLLVTVAGFALAEWRSQRVATTMLESRVGPAQIEGRVLGIDQTANGHRLLLDQLRVAGPGRGADAGPGALVAARCRRPRSGARSARALARDPAATVVAVGGPGAFDYQRFLFFAGIGATGTAYAPIELVRRPRARRPTSRSGWRSCAPRSRRVCSPRCPGDVGAVAAALIAGRRVEDLDADAAGLTAIPDSRICCRSPGCTSPSSPAS